MLVYRKLTEKNYKPPNHVNVKDVLINLNYIQNTLQNLVESIKERDSKGKYLPEKIVPKVQKLVLTVNEIKIDYNYLTTK